MQQSYNLFLISIIFLFFISCKNNVVIPKITNNISYPSSIISLNNTSFLLLNSSANDDYSDGSIQQYNVDLNGNFSLKNVVSVPAHGTEIAASPDAKLIALAFDSSVNPTQLQFLSYENPDKPKKISLSLNFYETGAKQSIKRLGFFSPQGGRGYYLYGVIYSFAQDDGSNAGIPPRVFVAHIDEKLSSAKLLFSLSYGIEKNNALAEKSDSNIGYSYSFGSSAPSFDTYHNLLIAFPTGSMGSLNAFSFPPYPPSIYDYFNKTIANSTSTSVASNAVACAPGINRCAQPDLRISSLFAVDFTDYLTNYDLNNASYFVPLAWNANGISYGSKTNDIDIDYAAWQKSGAGLSNNYDLTSFTFQTNFWESKWLNSINLASGLPCYINSDPTNADNAYNLDIVGANALLVSKYGLNGNFDKGFGDEIFQITGLDILSNSINTIKVQRKNYNVQGEKDFSLISAVQILDPYNNYYEILHSTWLNAQVSPILPYMYSRTTGNPDFSKTSSAGLNFSILNFGAGKCLPYWVRNTYLGFSNFGMDSAWLSANATPINTSSNAIYPNATIDPLQVSMFKYNSGSGLRLCTDVMPVLNKPIVFCANFLDGSISHFNTNNIPPIFMPQGN